MDLILSSVGSKENHVTFEADGQVEFVGAPHAFPRRETVRSIAAGFEGEGHSFPVKELEGEHGVGDALCFGKMVHDVPDVFDGVQIEGDVPRPRLIAVFCAPPSEVTDVREGHGTCFFIHLGRGLVAAIVAPVTIEGRDAATVDPVKQPKTKA